MPKAAWNDKTKAFVAAGYFCFSGATGVGDLGPGASGGIGPLPLPYLWRAAELGVGIVAYVLLVRVAIRPLTTMLGDSAATVYDITEVSVRQTLVHDRALGRVTSTFHVAAMIAQLAATLMAGVLGELIGVRATAWLAPIGGLIGAAVLWSSPVRHLRVLPPQVGEIEIDPIEAARATHLEQPPGV